MKQINKKNDRPRAVNFRWNRLKIREPRAKLIDFWMHWILRQSRLSLPLFLLHAAGLAGWVKGLHCFLTSFCRFWSSHSYCMRVSKYWWKKARAAPFFAPPSRPRLQLLQFQGTPRAHIISLFGYPGNSPQPTAGIPCWKPTPSLRKCSLNMSGSETD